MPLAHSRLTVSPGTEIVGPHVGQAPAKASDRRTHAVDQVHGLHDTNVDILLRPRTSLPERTLMAYRFILFEIDQGVARITLNRPDVLNSIHTAMSGEIQEALAQAAREREIRAVLLTGTGR